MYIDLNKIRFKKVTELKADDLLRTVYNYVIVTNVQIRPKTTKVWYKCTNGYESEKTFWVYKNTDNVQIIL